MKRTVAISVAALIAGCATRPGPPPPPPMILASVERPPSPQPAPIGPEEAIDTVTLCDLQRELENGVGRDRAVAMTAAVDWEMRYGISFGDTGCKGSWGLPAAMLTMSYADPAASNILSELWSNDAAQAHVGQRPMCVCVGRISFHDGHSEFQLIRVERTWWEAP